MIVEKVELRDFRNYPELEIDFASNTNLLTGRNAQGKSNLLEAIYLLSHLRSHRAGRMRDLVRGGKDLSTVTGTFRENDLPFTLRIAMGPEGRRAELNGQPQGSGGKVKGLVKCVMFTPDDLYMVKGEPFRRREYLDETMAGTGPSMAGLPNAYLRSLRQRNALLRGWERPAGLEEALAPWDEALARDAAPLIRERAKIVRRAGDAASRAYGEICGEEERLELVYRGALGDTWSEDGDITGDFLERLRRKRGEERSARTTLVGPHRDDVEIRLGKRDVRLVASQGEQRTVAFCLRAAQREYLADETGQAPILLLDDVFSELDEARRRKVVEFVEGGSQAIVTTAEDLSGLLGGGERVFEVREGTVRVV